MNKSDLKKKVAALVALENQVKPINEAIKELRDELKAVVEEQGSDYGDAGAKRLKVMLGKTEATLPIIRNNRYEEKKDALAIAKKMGRKDLIIQVIDKDKATKEKLRDEFFDTKFSYSMRDIIVTNSEALTAIATAAEILAQDN